MNTMDHVANLSVLKRSNDIRQSEIKRMDVKTIVQYLSGYITTYLLYDVCCLSAQEVLAPASWVNAQTLPWYPVVMMLYTANKLKVVIKSWFSVLGIKIMPNSHNLAEIAREMYVAGWRYTVEITRYPSPVVFMSYHLRTNIPGLVSIPFTQAQMIMYRRLWGLIEVVRGGEGWFRT